MSAFIPAIRASTPTPPIRSGMSGPSVLFCWAAIRFYLVADDPRCLRSAARPAKVCKMARDGSPDQQTSHRATPKAARRGKRSRSSPLKGDAGRQRDHPVFSRYSHRFAPPGPASRAGEGRKKAAALRSCLSPARPKWADVRPAAPCRLGREAGARVAPASPPPARRPFAINGRPWVWFREGLAGSRPTFAAAPTSAGLPADGGNKP